MYVQQLCSDMSHVGLAFGNLLDVCSSPIANRNSGLTVVQLYNGRGAHVVKYAHSYNAINRQSTEQKVFFCSSMGLYVGPI